MGKFWQTRVPRKVKRMVFIAKVTSAGESGLEALPISATQALRIDSQAAKLLRSLEQGKACLWQPEQGCTNESATIEIDPPHTQ